MYPVSLAVEMSELLAEVDRLKSEVESRAIDLLLWQLDNEQSGMLQWARTQSSHEKQRCTPTARSWMRSKRLMPCSARPWTRKRSWPYSEQVPEGAWRGFVLTSSPEREAAKEEQLLRLAEDKRRVEIMRAEVDMRKKADAEKAKTEEDKSIVEEVEVLEWTEASGPGPLEAPALNDAHWSAQVLEGVTCVFGKIS